MALLPNINVGSSPNDGTGSNLRDAFTIVNENFQLIEAFFPNSTVANLVANIESSGTSTFNYVNANVVYSSIFGNAGALYYGNIATAAQPNITSLGTLSTLTVNGTTTIDGTFVANSTLIAASSFVAQADVDFQGQQKVNVNIVAGTYSIANTDYFVQANVTGNANCTITVPNADISTGRVLEILYYDETAVNSNTTVVSVQVETGAGNIIASPVQVSQTGFDFTNELGRNSIKIISNGNNWLVV